MKRTCTGCRALDIDFCDLGYKVNQIYHRRLLYSEAIPAEECPKPRTYAELMGLCKVSKITNNN